MQTLRLTLKQAAAQSSHYQLSILGVDTRASHSPSDQHSNGS